MWSKLGRFILRNRVALLIVIGVLTIFFGYMATKIELSYTYARALPVDDPAYIEYEKYRSLFGEDGSVMVMGFKSENLFDLKKFNEWFDLSEKVKSLGGIQEVISLTKLYNVVKDDSLGEFKFIPLTPEKPKTQAELDSIKQLILSLPFYHNLILNPDSNATVMAITFNKDSLNSKGRIATVKEITDLGDQFATENNIDIHYSGMPYIRTVFMKKVAGELVLFLGLAFLVTALILWLFFRSFNAVFWSMIVVVIGVIWSLGILGLFGYKITVLSGLIPPLIIIIGLPNCIFLINKYQEELVRHGNKMKALNRTIEKVGLSNFLANVTTSIGFAVFYFTNSTMLVEFGIVAAVNVMATFIIALVFIPVIFSFLAVPTLKHTKHLQGKRINKIMDWVIHLIHNRRKSIYIVITLLTLVCAFGMTKIEVNGYVVDDLPKKDPIYTHLRFFESNFNGVVPFEVLIDTRQPNGVFKNNARTLYKIQTSQRKMKEYPAFSKPVSVVEGLKFAYQAYKDGNPKFYILPGSSELKKLSDYMQTVKGRENRVTAFMDSTKQYTRISYQMADIGSDSIKKLIAVIKPQMDTIFNWDEEKNAWAADSLKYNVSLTGFSHVFLKSNDYLLHHLFVALLIAIGLILLIGIALFRSVSIIVLSKIPALIPLIVTAGVMGFAGIPFKPSTILIFTISFGIASDGTIYILAEYRNQLKKGKYGDVNKAIYNTIRETGVSMIYTNVILFSGFAIFIASTFGGTIALGELLCLTLVIALGTNLVLLPAILLSLEKRTIIKAFAKDPLIDIYDEEEDIDYEKLVIPKSDDEKETKS